MSNLLSGNCHSLGKSQAQILGVSLLRNHLGSAVIFGLSVVASVTQARSNTCLNGLLSSDASNVSHSAFFAALSEVTRTPESCDTILAKATNGSGDIAKTHVIADLKTCRAAQQTWHDVRESESSAVFEIFADLFADCPFYAELARERLN
ncbi:MAG: hypothetical protein GJ677_04635 [Rhodobacteraceae bacterium]|nr:hypothetical protein [Paracoccaceae bacterium]